MILSTLLCGEGLGDEDAGIIDERIDAPEPRRETRGPPATRGVSRQPSRCENRANR
jgi:hypothetical protein